MAFDELNWIEVHRTSESLQTGKGAWAEVRLSHAGKELTLRPDRKLLGWDTRPDIYGIAYRDATHVWIWSRLGRRLSQLGLFEVPSLKCIKLYQGSLFRLSPDRQHVAWTYPSGMQDHQRAALFFDDQWGLAPRIRALSSKPGEPFDPENRNGDLWAEAGNQQGKLAIARWSPIWWRGERQFTLIAQPPNESYEEKPAEYTVIDVTLAADGTSTPTLKTRRIEAAAALRVKTEAYWDNGLTNDSAEAYLGRLDAEGFKPE